MMSELRQKSHLSLQTPPIRGSIPGLSLQPLLERRCHEKKSSLVGNRRCASKNILSLKRRSGLKGPARLKFETLEDRNLLSVTSLISPGGNETVDGGLRVNVDAYGAFGDNAYPADNAWFNPVGALSAAGTTYESGVYIGGAATGNGFMAEGDLANLSPIGFDSVTTTSAVSHFTRGNFSIVLTQSVGDKLSSTGTKIGSELVQTYAITNNGSDANFYMTRYLDGDLYFSGDFTNDWAGASTTLPTMDQRLFEFDSADALHNPTGVVALTRSRRFRFGRIFPNLPF